MQSKGKHTARLAAAGEVFAAFLKLGLTSFGGPIAHLGYYRRELIERRRWVDEAHYAQLLALCQFLPGPASSQLGFALGLIRAGWLGGLAAFVAFTAPSALLLYAFAKLLPLLEHPLGQAAIHGLKLVAVAVVAQGGVIGASLCLASIFLPGLLLVAGALPFWRAITSRRGAASSLAGVNAAVVGLLAAALYDPVWIGAVLGPRDFAVALIGFALLAATRVSSLAVVIWCVSATVLSAALI